MHTGMQTAMPLKCTRIFMYIKQLDSVFQPFSPLLAVREWLLHNTSMPADACSAAMLLQPWSTKEKGLH